MTKTEYARIKDRTNARKRESSAPLDFDWGQGDPFAKPALKSGPADWPDDVRGLVEWFGAFDIRRATQPAPIVLRTGVRVSDVERFLRSLRSDVEAGPLHPRATGLAIDLADLRQSVEGHDDLPLGRCPDHSQAKVLSSWTALRFLECDDSTGGDDLGGNPFALADAGDN